ncbi:unnamed protein product, partial [Meganyctiphanes norvegica]
ADTDVRKDLLLAQDKFKPLKEESKLVKRTINGHNPATSNIQINSKYGPHNQEFNNNDAFIEHFANHFTNQINNPQQKFNSPQQFNVHPQFKTQNHIILPELLEIPQHINNQFQTQTHINIPEHFEFPQHINNLDHLNSPQIFNIPQQFNNPNQQLFNNIPFNLEPHNYSHNQFNGQFDPYSEPCFEDHFNHNSPDNHFNHDHQHFIHPQYQFARGNQFRGNQARNFFIPQGNGFSGFTNQHPTIVSPVSRPVLL